MNKPFGGVYALEPKLSVPLFRWVERPRLGAGKGHRVPLAVEARLAGPLWAAATLPCVEPPLLLLLGQVPRFLGAVPEAGPPVQLLPRPRPPQWGHRELLPLLEEPPPAARVARGQRPFFAAQGVDSVTGCFKPPPLHRQLHL